MNGLEGVEGTLTRKVGPLPVGGWIFLVGGSAIAAYILSNRQRTVTTNTVQQVPVPVGAIASPDMAPLVMSPIMHVNVPAFEQLGAIVQANTDATLGNSGALGGNTGALTGNTAATQAATQAAIGNTAAVVANTAAVVAAPRPPSATLPTAQPAAPTPVKAPSARTYTVQSGDTLSGIAARFTGRGSNWPTLYRLNQTQIDTTARARGAKPPYYNRIWPGQRFTLPSGW